jgi:hypothetical protein
MVFLYEKAVGCLLATGLVLGTGACEQSDPEGTSDDYFPLAEGATWTYFHSSKGGWEETITVKKGEESGEFVFKDTENPDGESARITIVRDGSRAMRIGKEQYADGELIFTVVYDPGFVRFDDDWLEKKPPYEKRLAYQRTETDVGQDPKPTRDRGHIYTVESLTETVKVEGQTFRNCVRVRSQRDYEGTPAAADAGVSDPPVQEDQTKLYWFAPGVGKVKEQNLETDNTEVLVEYDIP